MSPELRPPLVRGLRPAAWMGLPWCAFALYVIASRPAQPSLWPTTLATGLVIAVAAAAVRRVPLISVALLVAGFVAGRYALGLSPAALPQLATTDVAVYFTAAACSRLTSGVAVVLTMGGAAACWIIGRPVTFPGAGLAELAAGLTVVVAWLIGHSVRQGRAYAEAARSHAVAQAVGAERLRIAREVHDMVAHSIGVIAIQAGMGSRVIETQPAEAHDALRAIEGVSRETLAGLRRVLGALREAGPDSAPPGSGWAKPAGPDPAPGLADVSALAETAGQAGLQVEVRWRGEHRALPADIELSAFRIIQEAVTNVLRHASASRCDISICCQPGELTVEVTDDGRGRSAAGPGYGIAGMRERVTLLHGDLAAGALPGGGFRVAARLPVPAGIP